MAKLLAHPIVQLDLFADAAPTPTDDSAYEEGRAAGINSDTNNPYDYGSSVGQAWARGNADGQAQKLAAGIKPLDEQKEAPAPDKPKGRRGRKNAAAAAFEDDASNAPPPAEENTEAPPTQHDDGDEFDAAALRH